MYWKVVCDMWYILAKRLQVKISMSDHYSSLQILRVTEEFDPLQI